MLSSHTHRLPCARVPDLIGYWRRPGACQALLQPAATEAQVGRQGAWQACLGSYINKVLPSNSDPLISGCSCETVCLLAAG